MGFLFSRNPVLGAIRFVVGIGLLAYGLANLAVANAGSGAAAISPEAYRVLPPCTTDAVPTDGTCYTVLRATVVTSRQALLDHYVTVTDAQGTRELRLIDAKGFDAFQPNVAVATKYWKSAVTGVGVASQDGGKLALTSTVDSPVAHAAAMATGIRFVIFGASAILFGGLPLLIGFLGRRSDRPVASTGAASAYGPPTGIPPPGTGYGAPLPPQGAMPPAAWGPPPLPPGPRLGAGTPPSTSPYGPTAAPPAAAPAPEPPPEGGAGWGVR